MFIIWHLTYIIWHVTSIIWHLTYVDTCRQENYTYTNKLNCGHVAMGFLHKACWLVRYSVMIESKVTLGWSEEGQMSSWRALCPSQMCGSKLICFCRRELGVGVVGKVGCFLEMKNLHFLLSKDIISFLLYNFDGWRRLRGPIYYRRCRRVQRIHQREISRRWKG